MDELIAFFRARLDEDGQTARRIKATRHGALIVAPGDGESPSVFEIGGDRLLAEVEAKRQDRPGGAAVARRLRRRRLLAHRAGPGRSQRPAALDNESGSPPQRRAAPPTSHAPLTTWLPVMVRPGRLP